MAHSLMDDNAGSASKTGEIVLLPALFFASKKGNEIMHKQSNILIAHPYVPLCLSPCYAHHFFPVLLHLYRQPSHPETHFRKHGVSFWFRNCAHLRSLRNGKRMAGPG